MKFHLVLFHSIDQSRYWRHRSDLQFMMIPSSYNLVAMMKLYHHHSKDEIFAPHLSHPGALHDQYTNPLYGETRPHLTHDRYKRTAHQLVGKLRQLYLNNLVAQVVMKVFLMVQLH